MMNERPSEWDYLAETWPEGVAKVRDRVVVDLVCTCQARPVLVRVLDTPHGRLVVSRYYQPPTEVLIAAKHRGEWDGGHQQDVPRSRPLAIPPGTPPLRRRRMENSTTLGFVGWTDRPSWMAPAPPFFFMGPHLPRCRCKAKHWESLQEFSTAVVRAVASAANKRKVVCPG